MPTKPKTCYVPGCPSSRETVTVEMYYFPKNRLMKSRWLRAMKMEGTKPTLFSFVCALHFDGSAFEKVVSNYKDGHRYVKNRRQLKSDAVPTIFPYKSPTISARKLPKVRSPTNSTARPADITHDHFGYFSKVESEPRTNFNLCPDLERLKLLEARSEHLTKLERALRKFFGQDQIDVLVGLSKRPQWSDDTIQRSIHMHYVCKESGYNHLRSMGFPLPTASCLSKRLACFDFDPGKLLEVNFKLLETRIQHLNSKQDAMCALVFDELGITPSIEYDLKTKKITGYATLPVSGTTKKQQKGIVEVPVGEFDNIASKAQIYMLAGLRERWKGIVAYDLTSKSFDAPACKARVEDIINKADSIGAEVKVLTNDSGTLNKAV